MDTRYFQEITSGLGRTWVHPNSGVGLTGVNVTPPGASDWLRNQRVTQFWPTYWKGNEFEGFSGENAFVSEEATAEDNLLSSVSPHQVWTLHLELPSGMGCPLAICLTMESSQELQNKEMRRTWVLKDNPGLLTQWPCGSYVLHSCYIKLGRSFLFCFVLHASLPQGFNMCSWEHLTYVFIFHLFTFYFMLLTISFFFLVFCHSSLCCIFFGFVFSSELVSMHLVFNFSETWVGRHTPVFLQVSKST